MPGIYIGTSKLKCAYVGTTPVKCIYVGTTKVRPTNPTIDYLIAGGGGGGGTACNNRQGGGGGGGGQVKYCCGYEINTGSYTVTVGSGGATATGGGTSCFNGISSKGGCGGTSSPGCVSSYWRSGSGGASGSGCAGGACAGYSNRNCCTSGGGGGGQCGAGCNGASRTAYSNGGAGISLNFTGANVEYGKGGQGGPYPTQTTPLCSQGGVGCGSSGAAQDGGGGIVIIKYPSSCGYSITGGTKTSATISGVTYCIHCFTSNGTLTVS